MLYNRYYLALTSKCLFVLHLFLLVSNPLGEDSCTSIPILCEENAQQSLYHDSHSTAGIMSF